MQEKGKIRKNIQEIILSMQLVLKINYFQLSISYLYTTTEHYYYFLPLLLFFTIVAYTLILSITEYKYIHSALST